MPGAAAFASGLPTGFTQRRREVTDKRQARAIEQWNGDRAVHEYCDALSRDVSIARAPPLAVAIYVDRMNIRR